MSSVPVRKIIHRAGGAFCASVEQRAGLLPLPQGVRVPGVTLSNLSPAGLAAGPAARATACARLPTRNPAVSFPTLGAFTGAILVSMAGPLPAGPAAAALPQMPFVRLHQLFSVCYFPDSN